MEEINILRVDSFGFCGVATIAEMRVLRTTADTMAMTESEKATSRKAFLFNPHLLRKEVMDAGQTGTSTVLLLHWGV